MDSNSLLDSNDNWKVVGKKKKINKVNNIEDSQYKDMQEDKITEPCWFFNNGGCRHKDGTEKLFEECKYLHHYSSNVKRPPHLCIKKPCDKYNLEGICQWHDNCKYSHRDLSPEEWSRYYPGMPYTMRTNVQKRLQLENRLIDIEGRMQVAEFKQDGISRDIREILQQLKILIEYTKLSNL